MVWEDLIDIWRVFGGILPLYKIQGQTEEKQKTTEENLHFLILDQVWEQELSLLFWESLHQYLLHYLLLFIIIHCYLLLFV